MTQTQPRYRVLLIGIDDYQKRPLSGCVNDIDRVQTMLLDKLAMPTAWIRRLASPRATATHSKAVPEKVANLENIRNELAALARDAQEGERVFIYYSGHGVRAAFERSDGRLFHRESLVPVDVDMSDDKRLLADYELNTLLGHIATRTTSVTMVLDCCHSAGATRDPGLPRLRRRAMDARDDLGWTKPLRANDVMELPMRFARGERSRDRALDDCHVVAACLNHELAAESTSNEGVHFGVLTDALMRSLSGVPQAELRTVPWARIWQAMRETVRAHNPWQNPWMSGNPSRAVLAGPAVDGDAGLAIRRVGDTYELDAGTLASINRGARVAVYGEKPLCFPPLGTPDDDTYRRGVLRVTEATLSSATASAEGAAFPLPPGARGRIIEVGKPARLRCALLPPNEGIAATLRESPLIEVADKAVAKVRLECVDGDWLLTDDKHKETAAAALLVLKASDLPSVRDVLEHYYLYALPLRMAEAAADLPGKLELRILLCDKELSPQQAQDAALDEAGSEIATGTRVCFRVRNTSHEQLRVTLLNSAASGKVQLLGDQVIGPYSDYVFWAGGALGRPFAMTLPQGKQQGIDRLTAIGTTALSKDLGYLRVNRKFADILAVTRGTSRDTAKDIGDEEDARTNAPVEQWTSASAVLTTRAN